MARFEKLLQPGRIGSMEVKNRIVLPPMVRNYADERGFVTEVTKAHFDVMSKGGAGLVIVGAARMDDLRGKSFIKDLSIGDDKYMPGLKELVEIIHRNGAKTAIQIYHAGGSARRRFISLEPVSASAVAMPGEELPRALKLEEIPEIIELYVKAVHRAREVGFDCVEIHANHRDLINQFLSSAWNKRQDAYGGDLKNRARFVTEILRAVKSRVGNDYPVGLRINGAEYGVEGGTTPGESQDLAPLLEEAGANYIHVSVYGFGGQFRRISQPEQIFYPEPPDPPPDGLDMSRHGPGASIPLAAAIKKRVSIPVIAVGRLDPYLAEEVLEQGKADFVAFARRLLADPELPNKVASGRLSDIRPCTGCLTCRTALDLEEPVHCQVNASLGREKEYEIKPAEKKKTVVVIGGGPAGMEAARMAALRGHKVKLYEKESRLGGAMPIAAMIKDFLVKDLLDFCSYLEAEIKKLNIEVHLKQEATPELITSIKPDAVIIATGGTFAPSEIPGADSSKVMSSAALHGKVKSFLRSFNPSTLGKLSRYYLPIGKRVVIIGGAIQGFQVAGFLTKRGRKVTIIETSNKLGTGMIEPQRLQLSDWLKKKGMTAFTEAKCEAINDKGVIVATKDGQKQTVEADTVLITPSPQPDMALLKALEGKVPEVYVVGDCKEPRLIVDAINDGYRTGMTI